MKNLIKLQTRIMFKQKSYYICLIIFLLMGPIMSFAGIFNTNEYAATKVFPAFIKFTTGELSIVSIIFITLFTCIDFSEGTAKNIIGRGYSRKQLLFSKCIVSLIGVISFNLIAFIVLLAMYGLNGLGFSSTTVYSLINNIFATTMYVILFTTLSFILEKSGVSIIVCIFAPIIIQSILGLIDSKLKLSICKYWISDISHNFIANPTLSNLVGPIILYTIYGVIFIILGINIVKKREIK